MFRIPSLINVCSSNDVAIAGGHILDICTRSDSMTTGQRLVDNNGAFNVIITKS
jgi:hypothetical protein